MPFAKSQKVFQRCQRPSAQDICLNGTTASILCADPCGKAQRFRRRLKKRRLPSIALNKRHLQIWRFFLRKNGNDDPRKAASAAKICPVFSLRSENKNLRRIEKMSTPDLLQRLRRDQIDRCVPFPKQLFEGIQEIQCFT